MSRTLIPHCIGILFRRCTSRRKTGHQIFKSFKEENQQCFWNVELTEAVNDLIYIGFIRPGTLFISSTQPNALNVIRYAWINRILRPAKGYDVLTVGDVPATQIHEIEQINQQPVADIICSTVAKLNKNGYPATYETVCTELSKCCANLPLPTPVEIRKIIEALLNAELLYLLGENLFLSKGSTAPYTIYHKVSVKCNAECQTGKSIICSPDCEGKQEMTPKQRKGFIARLFARRNSPIKVATKKKDSTTVSGQLPTSGWPTESIPNENKAKSVNEQRDLLQRFGCYTDCLPMPEPEIKKLRMKHCRGANPLKSNLDCLNYGLVDPPEYLPYNGAPESLVPMEEWPQRRTKLRRRTVCGDVARTSTPVPDGSDSAYSISPVITEMSSESRDPSRSPSLTDSHTNVDNRHQIDEHTYVNMYSHESTQFEEITQIERLQVSNVQNELINRN